MVSEPFRAKPSQVHWDNYPTALGLSPPQVYNPTVMKFNPWCQAVCWKFHID